MKNIFIQKPHDLGEEKNELIHSLCRFIYRENTRGICLTKSGLLFSHNCEISDTSIKTSYTIVGWTFKNLNRNRWREKKVVLA